MKLMKIFSFIAINLLNKEWYKLNKSLIKIYDSYNKSILIPSILAQQLLISGEDHRFFQHRGIDYIAVCRAIWRRITQGRHEGASTIEMQIVRIVSGRFEHTLKRKISEMLLATLLTSVIPKEQLPALYLQIGYYGWRMNGFNQACRRLGLSVDKLTPIETAQLVARLKYPQPHHLTLKRWTQIKIRGRHLLYLHKRHKLNQTYFGLNITTAHGTI